MNILLLSDEKGKKFLELNLSKQIENTVQGLGFHTRFVEIKGDELKSCTRCFGCWTKTPGLCVFTKDEVNQINYEFIHSDVVIFISNIVYGCYSYHIKRYLDRLIPNISPNFVRINGETHHQKRYKNYPYFIYIGFGSDLTQSDKETFITLNKRNSINFYSPKNLSLIIESQADSTKAVSKLTEFLSGEVLL